MAPIRGEVTMKRFSGRSAWACAAVIAVSVGIAMIGSTAKAQNGWGDDASQDAAKKVPPPPPPPPLQIAGPWVGTIQDSHQGPGTVSLSFTEKKGSKTKST